MTTEFSTYVCVDCGMTFPAKLVGGHACSGRVTVDRCREIARDEIHRRETQLRAFDALKSQPAVAQEREDDVRLPGPWVRYEELEKARAERDALRKERDDLKRELVNCAPHGYFTNDRQALVVERDALRAKLAAAEGALRDLLNHVDAETCLHEERRRGGAIWEICNACGQSWADDQGGFQPHVDAAAVAAARKCLVGGEGKAS